MKKLLPLMLAVVFFMSCSLEDEAGNISQVLAPVLSADLPENFLMGEDYEIEIVYKRPTNCHNFSGLDLTQNTQTITVGVVTNFRTTNTNCVSTGNLEASAIINFVAEREDFYIFKFWQGRTAGRDNFLIIEVPVVQPGEENNNLTPQALEFKSAHTQL